MLTSSICTSHRRRDVAENKITIMTSFSEDNIVLVCISCKGFGLIWQVTKIGFFNYTHCSSLSLCVSCTEEEISNFEEMCTYI